MAEYETTHSTTVAADCVSVYELVRDVTNWPVIFQPTVYVEHITRAEDTERFRIWATANDGVAGWTSRRTLDPRALRIGFAQERSQPPVASMRGEWEFCSVGDGRTEIVLSHWFTAVDDGADAVRWIQQALDRNSAAELAGLRKIAELAPPLADVLFSFDDVVTINGSVADAYRFVYEAAHWPSRLPHVRRVDLTEAEPGLQQLEMDTVTADGSTHTTKSVRICFPDRLISYKQIVVPELLLGHSGRWSFTEADSSAQVTATHTVLIKTSAIPDVLGPGATLSDARVFARNALGGNSRTTLAHAKAFAEESVREGT